MQIRSFREKLDSMLQAFYVKSVLKFRGMFDPKLILLQEIRY